MFIVLVTHARPHPADGQHDDVTYPALMTEDLQRAVVYAQSITGATHEFVGTETQGVRIFPATRDRLNLGDTPAFYSRTPVRKFPDDGGDKFLWKEVWHDQSYLQVFQNLRKSR